MSKSHVAAAQNQQDRMPYVCFVEPSGLLVVVSFSGYICKYAIDIVETFDPQKFAKSMREQPASSAQRAML